MKWHIKNKKKTVLFFVFLLFVSGFSFLIFGTPLENNTVQQSDATPNFWALTFKTIMLLGFTILLIYLVLYLLRRFVYRKNSIRSNGSVEILKYVPLVSKKSMCVVKVVDCILVLGISESGITKLVEISDDDRQKIWESELNLNAPQKQVKFAEQLQNFLGYTRNKN